MRAAAAAAGASVVVADVEGVDLHCADADQGGRDPAVAGQPDLDPTGQPDLDLANGTGVRLRVRADGAMALAVMP